MPIFSPCDGGAMGISKEFDRYMAHLAEGLGHADRHAGLSGYCTGLMLPLSRKSVEPMAARVDPLRASARHQALHHFVAKAQWSDQQLLNRVAQWVVPHMDFSAGGWNSPPTRGRARSAVRIRRCKSKEDSLCRPAHGD